MSDHERRFFDAIARRYDRVYALSGPASRRRLAEVLGLLSPSSRVLCLGIGTGRELPALLDAGHSPTGLDVSAEMIALCNKRSRTIPITHGSFWDPLPFEDGSFDAVLALHGTLAHPPALEILASLAREVRRVLRASGVFVAEVPARAALSRLEEGTISEGVAFVRTGPTSFTHRDDVAGVSLDGIALDAEGWRGALAPLAVAVEPLGTAEFRLVGR